MYSKVDNRGRVYVDCTECERGVNGQSDSDKCSCGWQRKRPGMGCFCGDLLPQYIEEARKKIVELQAKSPEEQASKQHSHKYQAYHLYSVEQPFVRVKERE